MSGIDFGRAFHLAWRVLGKLPGPVVRTGFNIAADFVWMRRPKGVRQLERNLARVRPGSPRDLRALSKTGMRSYLRYYAEAFTLPKATPEQIAARVRVIGFDTIRAFRDEGRSVVGALGHLGNWDLAGAYSGLHIMPVLTVAERLEPESLFEEFRSFREELGMRILALGDDEVFRSLLRGCREGGFLVPLLADRDLTAKGIEVDLLGHRARVAAGPAALAAATGAPLIPVAIRYERLKAQRRRAAGTPWGIVIEFLPVIDLPRDVPKGERIRFLTQGWVDSLGEAISSHPEDWHMLQKVFIADLDPEQYARTTSETGESS